MKGFLIFAALAGIVVSQNDPIPGCLSYCLLPAIQNYNCSIDIQNDPTCACSKRSEIMPQAASCLNNTCNGQEEVDQVNNLVTKFCAWSDTYHSITTSATPGPTETPTNAPINTPPPSSNNGLSVGAKAAIGTVVPLVTLSLIALILLCLTRRRRNKRKADEQRYQVMAQKRGSTSPSTARQTPIPYYTELNPSPLDPIKYKVEMPADHPIRSELPASEVMPKMYSEPTTRSQSVSTIRTAPQELDTKQAPTTTDPVNFVSPLSPEAARLSTLSSFSPHRVSMPEDVQTSHQHPHQHPHAHPHANPHPHPHPIPEEPTTTSSSSPIMPGYDHPAHTPFSSAEGTLQTTYRMSQHTPSTARQTFLDSATEDAEMETEGSEGTFYSVRTEETERTSMAGTGTTQSGTIPIRLSASVVEGRDRERERGGWI